MLALMMALALGTDPNATLAEPARVDHPSTQIRGGMTCDDVIWLMPRQASRHEVIWIDDPAADMPVLKSTFHKSNVVVYFFANGRIRVTPYR